MSWASHLRNNSHNILQKIINYQIGLNNILLNLKSFILLVCKINTKKYQTTFSLSLKCLTTNFLHRPTWRPNQLKQSKHMVGTIYFSNTIDTGMILTSLTIIAQFIWNAHNSYYFENVQMHSTKIVDGANNFLEEFQTLVDKSRVSQNYLFCARDFWPFFFL